MARLNAKYISKFIDVSGPNENGYYRLKILTTNGRTFPVVGWLSSKYLNEDAKVILMEHLENKAKIVAKRRWYYKFRSWFKGFDSWASINQPNTDLGYVEDDMKAAYKAGYNQGVDDSLSKIAKQAVKKVQTLIKEGPSKGGVNRNLPTTKPNIAPMPGKPCIKESTGKGKYLFNISITNKETGKMFNHHGASDLAHMSLKEGVNQRQEKLTVILGRRIECPEAKFLGKVVESE